MTRMTRLALALLLALPSAALAQGYPAEKLLTTAETVMGEKIAYPPGDALVEAAIVTLAPGETTILHRHGVPFFAYILEGEITVDYGPHGRRTYRRGDALMEAMETAHAGQNTGSVPVRLLGVYMGATGAANVIPAR